MITPTAAVIAAGAVIVTTQVLIGRGEKVGVWLAGYVSETLILIMLALFAQCLLDIVQ